MLVCGKKFGEAANSLNGIDCAAGVEFGEDVNVPSLLAAIKEELTVADKTDVPMDTLDQAIVYQAQKMPHLPIEGKIGLASFAFMKELVEAASTKESQAEIHANEVLFARKDELIGQLISSLSVECVCGRDCQASAPRLKFGQFMFL